MFARSALSAFLPPLSLHRAVHRVQPPVFVTTWLKGKIVLRICLLRTQFVMFASFKGAIDVNFFGGPVDVPSNDL